AAEARRIFVNAVDDPANASAFLSGVLRRDGVTVAISTSGDAPALTALVREGLDALLPDDLTDWMTLAKTQRLGGKHDGVPMAHRKPALLRALNESYENGSTRAASGREKNSAERPRDTRSAHGERVEP